MRRLRTFPERLTLNIFGGLQRPSREVLWYMFMVLAYFLLAFRNPSGSRGLARFTENRDNLIAAQTAANKCYKDTSGCSGADRKEVDRNLAFAQQVWSHTVGTGKR